MYKINTSSNSGRRVGKAAARGNQVLPQAPGDGVQVTVNPAGLTDGEIRKHCCSNLKPSLLRCMSSRLKPQERVLPGRTRMLEPWLDEWGTSPEWILQCTTRARLMRIPKRSWMRSIIFFEPCVLMKRQMLIWLHITSMMWHRYGKRCGQMAEHQDISPSLGIFSRLPFWRDSFQESNEKPRFKSSSTWDREVCKSRIIPWNSFNFQGMFFLLWKISGMKWESLWLVCRII